MLLQKLFGIAVMQVLRAKVRVRLEKETEPAADTQRRAQHTDQFDLCNEHTRRR